MSKIKMQGVRLSFPSLFQFGSFGGNSTNKYEATFILDKDKDATTIEAINVEIKKLIKDSFKGKSVGDDKICLKDGDDSERAEFQGMMSIKASTKKRPLIINQDKSPIVEEDNIIYAGCYVNAIISLWAQDNQYGKRINGQIEGIQFHSDGEPFGDSTSATVNDFDSFDDSDQDEIEF